jgi:hypothetical protein
MKFSEYIKNVENADIYPMVSLVIFSVVFLIAALYAFTASKKKMDDNANIPLK